MREGEREGKESDAVSDNDSLHLEIQSLFVVSLLFYPCPYFLPFFLLGNNHKIIIFLWLSNWEQLWCKSWQFVSYGFLPLSSSSPFSSPDFLVANNTISSLLIPLPFEASIQKKAESDILEIEKMETWMVLVRRRVTGKKYFYPFPSCLS